MSDPFKFQDLEARATNLPKKRQRDKGVDWSLEKLKINHSRENSQNRGFNDGIAKIPLNLETTCLKKIKPRAIIFKANNGDFCKLTDLIKTQFPEVEIVYVTTGPVASILRVIKSIPFEIQNSFEQPNYTIE